MAIFIILGIVLAGLIVYLKALLDNTVKDKEEIESLFLETMKKRALSQPLEFPSAGSVFKKVDGLNISKMLDDCGLKGLTLGDAQVSLKHANFIVNIGEATAQDIYYLIRIVQKRFKDRTGIDLAPEIKFLGEFNEITR